MGIVTLVKLVQLKNARISIVVIPLPIIAVVIPLATLYQGQRLPSRGQALLSYPSTDTIFPLPSIYSVAVGSSYRQVTPPAAHCA